jgi:heat shock protein HslJ
MWTKIILLLLLVLVIQTNVNENSPLAPGKYKADPENLELSGMETEFTFSNELMYYRECNNYRCQFKQEGDSISIGLCGGTKMYCQ